MSQGGPVALKDAREVFFVKASLVVWVIVAFDQGSIVTDHARNKGRFAGEWPQKFPIVMLSNISWSFAIMSCFSEGANDG